MSKATVSFTSIAIACGKLFGNIAGLEKQALAFKEELNKNVQELHKAKVKVGIYRKDGTGCAIATAFIDGCVEAGLSQSTAQKTYLPTFKKAVADGKPVTDLNSQRKNGKGRKGKVGKKSELSELLVKAFNHAEGASFEELCATIEAGFEDAKYDSLYEGFKDYLAEAGYEIK